MSGPVRSWRASAVMLGAVCLLTACSTDTIPVQTTITPSDEPIPTLAATPTGTESGTALPTSPTIDPNVVAFVNKIGLQPGDLPAGSDLTIRPSAGGNQVAGQVTLDNCGHQFLSEKHRVARREVDILDSAGARIGVSNEVVAYESAARAGEALREWRASVTACRKGTLIQPPEVGAPRIRYDSETTASDDTLPVAENTVTTVVMTVTATHAKRYAMAVLQQHGAVLNIMWLQTTAAPLRSQIRQLTGYAASTGRRLADG